MDQRANIQFYSDWFSNTKGILIFLSQNEILTYFLMIVSFPVGGIALIYATKNICEDTSLVMCNILLLNHDHVKKFNLTQDSSSKQFPFILFRCYLKINSNYNTEV